MVYCNLGRILEGFGGFDFIGLLVQVNDLAKGQWCDANVSRLQFEN